MRRCPSYLLLLLLLLFSQICQAQTTKVRGRVTDEAGEGIPFVGVWFKGTTTGITTDLDGYYSLENHDLSARVLTAQLLGYDPVEKEIEAGKFSQVDFTLRLSDNRLSGASVKADNRKARELLANIQKHRDRNDPDRHQEYEVDLYTVMELDMTHPREQIRNKRFRKDFGFVFDYIDTSSVSGVPYLPVMISETVTRRRHKGSVNNERILGNRISGINPEGNILSQFTGSLHLRVNFYRSFINAFGVEFPSPIQAAGLMYYNYYIIDTLNIDNRRTLLVRYHPKALVSTPTFDGEMKIDAEDFAIRSIHANMKNTTNVNWLRDLVIDAEYARQPDSSWFYRKDALYADFSVSKSDSSTFMSFIGRREIDYGEPDFSGGVDISSSMGLVNVDPGANYRDEAYWSAARPRPLSKKEQGVYEMVDRVKTVPLYKSLYDIIYTAINGYYEFGKVGVGPYFKLVSFNELEGVRPQLGFRTSKKFSLTDRLTGYLAYGTKDRGLKGGVTWEHLWSKEPQRKLTVGAKYDVNQLGSSHTALSEGNLLASLFGGNRDVKLLTMSDFSLRYEHEFSMMLNGTAGINLRRYYPSEKNWVREQRRVPMYDRNGEPVESVAANEISGSLRFSYEETVNRGPFTKTYIHSFYPVVTLSAAASIPGIRKNDYGYFRPELTVSWRKPLAPIGVSTLYLNAGKIFGTVPYPLLHMHAGNNTYMLNRYAFSCMKYMEFASDEWVTLYYMHCFNGFFFGKIPVIRMLGLREEFTFKATYGSLSDKNLDGPLLLPDGTSPLGGTPYMEIGAGVSNILKFIRLDYFRRLTHHREGSNHAFMIGAEFKF